MGKSQGKTRNQRQKNVSIETKLQNFEYYFINYAAFIKKYQNFWNYKLVSNYFQYVFIEILARRCCRQKLERKSSL